MSIIAKLGDTPQRSLRVFIVGLVFFAIGLAFIFLGYFNHHYWQILGMVFLAIGIILSVWGYVGIFANRLLTMLNRHPK